MQVFKVGDKVRFKLAFRPGSGVKLENLDQYRGVVESIDFDNRDVVHVKWQDPKARSEFGVHMASLEEDPDV